MAVYRTVMFLPASSFYDFFLQPLEGHHRQEELLVQQRPFPAFFMEIRQKIAGKAQPLCAVV
jgi:hypothetical protein